MTELNAALAGEFTIGSDITINRLGFGAMRLTGPGIWGEPENPEECLRVLRRLPELGVNFIDTADAYGPHVSEMLIRQALYPYDGLVIATKGGLVRTGPDQWIPVGRPEYLRESVLMSMRRLGVDRIDLWQLHRIDPKVPRDEQFDAIRGFIKEGLVRYVGLSQVGIRDIEVVCKLGSRPVRRAQLGTRRSAEPMSSLTIRTARTRRSWPLVCATAPVSRFNRRPTVLGAWSTSAMSSATTRRSNMPPR
jgi:pyridoxine 4-dehydrogenase